MRGVGAFRERCGCRLPLMCGRFLYRCSKLDLSGKYAFCSLRRLSSIGGRLRMSVCRPSAITVKGSNNSLFFLVGRRGRAGAVCLMSTNSCSLRAPCRVVPGFGR